MINAKRRTAALLIAGALASACSVAEPAARSDQAATPRPSHTPTSDDGYEISFVSKRDGYWSIYTVNNDGDQAKELDIVSVKDGPQRFALDLLGQPDWASDGLSLLFTCTPRRSEICLKHPDGVVQRLTGEGGDPETNAEWMPNGDEIVYSSYREGSYDIYAMNSDGSDQRPLIEGPGDESGPTVSPDGRILAFTVRDGARFSVKLAS